MRRRGMTLFEVTAGMALLAILTGILAPITVQLLRESRRQAVTSGLTIDHLAWEIRLAAARGWYLDDQGPVLAAQRWGNGRHGVERDGVPRCSGATLSWELAEDGSLLLQLSVTDRPPLNIRCPFQTRIEQP